MPIKLLPRTPRSTVCFKATVDLRVRTTSVRKHDKRIVVVGAHGVDDHAGECPRQSDSSNVGPVRVDARRRNTIKIICVDRHT